MLTLPTDSEERKEIPLYSGCLAYFPAALAGVARHSFKGNQKHNPGQTLHHARGKSMDHKDCILRHLVDLGDLERASQVDRDAALAEADAICWRALALSQELHEKFGAPLAPSARLPQDEPISSAESPREITVEGDEIPGSPYAACEE